LPYSLFLTERLLVSTTRPSSAENGVFYSKNCTKLQDTHNMFNECDS
jgi:hypothetical protein